MEKAFAFPGVILAQEVLSPAAMHPALPAVVPEEGESVNKLYLIQSRFTIKGLSLGLLGLVLALSEAGMSAPVRGVSELALETKRRWGMAMELELSSSLHDPGSADHSSEANLLVSPSYQLSDELKLAAVFTLQKELENELKAAPGNTRLSLTRTALQLNPYLSLAPGVGATLATSKESIRRDSLRFALNVNGRLAADLSRLGLSGLSVSTKLVATQSSHEFKTQRTGASNTSRSIRNELEVAYAILDKLEVSGLYLRGFGWTYDGAVKQNFELSQALSYSATDKLSLSVAHTNSGNAYKENGKDSSLALFDRNGSSVSGSMSLVF